MHDVAFKIYCGIWYKRNKQSLLALALSLYMYVDISYEYLNEIKTNKRIKISVQN